MLHLNRPMPARDAAEAHRAATQLELFFDLVAVIAIATLTAQFHHAISAGHGVEALPYFLLLFTAIWWAWMNFTWFASGFDNDDGIYRLFTIVIMAGFLAFAAGIEHLFQTQDSLYSLIGWVIMRIGMMGLWLRAARHNPDKKAIAMRQFWGLLVAQSLWVLLLTTVESSHPLYLLMGAFVFVVEFSIPIIASKVGTIPWHRHHIIERYGLLNTIVLGEVLLSISFMLAKLYSGHFDLVLVGSAISGLVIVFVVWWVYFLEHEHLNSTKIHHVFIWGYGHLAIFFSGAMLAAGLGAHLDVLTHHSEVTTATAALYTNGAVAIYFITLWIIRDVHHPLGLRNIVLPVSTLCLVIAAYLGAGPEITAVLCVLTLILRIPLSRDQTE